MELHDRLASAVTQYDMQQSTKRGYNRYALAMYLGAVQQVDEAIANGTDVRTAIVDNFNGHLLDRCLKAAGLPTSTKAEQMGSLTGPRL